MKMRRNLFAVWGIFLCVFCIGQRLYAQQADSTATQLDRITVTDTRTPSDFKSNLPVQTLSKNILQQINALSIGDAARFFSGVLVKDYGGVGGLKTVSVRGLGSANTEIIYDGIPVSDVQTGEIDLSRFSSLLVSSLSVYQSQPTGLLVPARAYASASTLDIRTIAGEHSQLPRPKWKGNITTGSFGLWQSALGVAAPIGEKTTISIDGSYLHSKGDYHYLIRNGNLEEKKRRSNSQMNALQGEINLDHSMKDSSFISFKAGIYDSKRGLPGVVIFFNPRSAEKLRNRNLFAQTQYRRSLGTKTTLLLSGKYSDNKTRYHDPDFPNNQGGIDDRYDNREGYLSVVVKRDIGRNLSASLANDYSHNSLSSDKRQFAMPIRNSLWNTVALQFTRNQWRINGNLLHTYFKDKTEYAPAAGAKDRITPSVSVRFVPNENSPLVFRAFYKQVFRMPTFNDLYYNLIGNRNLKPESAHQYNLGVTWTSPTSKKGNKVNASIDGYYNRISDKIIAVPNQNLFIWSMFNLGKATISGVDMNLESNIALAHHWSLFARLAYTYQQALDKTNKTSATYNNRIPYTPDHSGSGIFLFTHRDWTIGYSTLFSGARYALRANDATNKLTSWTTHDCSIARSVKLGESTIQLKAELDNITGKNYDIIRYYPMPGRNFKININLEL